MSECMTCRFATYDGTCLAKGKLTTPDAPACELYGPTEAAQMAALKRENRKLREQIDRWKKLAVEQEVVYVEHEQASERENAELRELVRDMWDDYWPLEPDDSVWRDYSDRLRELGIEVGE